jgi:hypothetical protein
MPVPQVQPDGHTTLNGYTPNMNAIRAIRRKSRRLSSDILVPPFRTFMSFTTRHSTDNAIRNRPSSYRQQTAVFDAGSAAAV